MLYAVFLTPEPSSILSQLSSSVYLSTCFLIQYTLIIPDRDSDRIPFGISWTSHLLEISPTRL
jgi:hypothetical protein